jgi:putative ABC transport system permease protein
MVPVARRNLLADKIRLLISVGGVTFAVLLIVVVQSLYQGYSLRLGSFAERVPVDLWIVEADTNGFIYASLIPESRQTEIAAVPGVGQVVRLYGRRLRFTTAEGRIDDAYFLAYDLPPALATAAGLDLPTSGELVVDRVLANQDDLDVGDTVTVRGRQLTVSAVADLAGTGLTQFVVVSVADARQALMVPGYVSFLLVRVSPGASPEAVGAAIEQSVPGVRAMAREAFAAANRAEVSGLFVPIVRVLLVVAFLVGAAVVGVTIYTATVERTREYGVLKALGASARDLLRIVLTQSVAVGIAGFAIGVPLAAGVNRVAAHFVPRFITLIRWQDLVLVFAAALGMAVIAAAIPIRRVATIDPASVFRA